MSGQAAQLKPMQVEATADSFRRWLKFSLGAHAVLVLFFVVRLSFFSSEPIEFQSAIRVDMVALPDKVIDQALNKQAAKETPPAPKEESKPEPKGDAPAAPKVEAQPAPKLEAKRPPKVNLEKPKVDLKSLQKEQNKAIEKLKAMEAVEEILHEENKPRPKLVPKAVSTVTRGNVIAAGTSLKGINKLDFDQYLGDLDTRVKASWNLPEWLLKLDLHAKAVVYLDAAGIVVGRKLIAVSGNPQFDSYVLKAIDDSSPFPKPPEKFVAILRTNGIVFAFPD